MGCIVEDRIDYFVVGIRIFLDIESSVGRSHFYFYPFVTVNHGLNNQDTDLKA